MQITTRSGQSAELLELFANFALIRLKHGHHPTWIHCKLINQRRKRAKAGQ